MDWNKVSQEELAETLKLNLNVRHAKNVILFMGDGMGFSNNAASRVYKAQNEGTSFKDARLAFDKFPYVGLSMTYCVDQLVTDSAAAATAYLCGEKARAGVIGVNQNVYLGRCDLVNGNKLTSILRHSHNAGKMTGVVTTTSITNASPAAAYANSPHRRWEVDSKMPPSASQCKDIARQLIEDTAFMNVILSGGRSYFLPNTTTDPEYPSQRGKRADGRNLIQEWKTKMAASPGMAEQYKYVENLEEFNMADPNKLQHLFGLFEPVSMHYEVDRMNSTKNPWPEPSISEMTEKAIKTLSKAEKGYFLFVEGGRIDHAHHDNNAFRAVNDTVAFSEAVKKAVEMTDDDTLILVTADHSHAFTFGGYSEINTDILGLVTEIVNGSDVKLLLADDGLPFTTLSYSNGPSYVYHHTNGTPGFPIRGRKNLTEDGETGKTAGYDYVQDSGVPLRWEAHGGEDVPLYGRGPLAHLVSGTHEQPYIAHLVMYASCVGPPGVRTFCDDSATGAGKWGTSGAGPRRPRLGAGGLLVIVATVVVALVVVPRWN